MASRSLRFIACLGVACLVLTPIAVRPAVAFCGDRILDPGEGCDRGTRNGAPDSCCTDNCQTRPATYTCRSSQGECDVPDVCDSSDETGRCPYDQKIATTGRPTGFLARAARSTARSVIPASSAVAPLALATFPKRALGIPTPVPLTACAHSVTYVARPSLRAMAVRCVMDSRPTAPRPSRFPQARSARMEIHAQLMTPAEMVSAR